MILYVDETENEEYFIVAGLLVDSYETVELAYRQFKNSIRGFKISDKAKSRLFTEFKSTLMDSRFQRVKVKMLDRVCHMDARVVYSCYKKSSNPLNQELKESTYVTLIKAIIDSIPEEMDVVFDRFGIERFENTIVSNIKGDHILSVAPQDSQMEEGLQFIDNICSVIRFHLSGKDVHNFYGIIQNMIEESCQTTIEESYQTTIEESYQTTIEES